LAPHRNRNELRHGEKKKKEVTYYAERSINCSHEANPILQQEKRYRSMQEHIRRAHPNHYIPKLPATEESFIMMVTTPLDQRAHLTPPQTQSRRRNGQFWLSRG
jgi:hypothetical protein